MMQLKDLRTFVLTAQAGSLHRAAERAGVSQPAISKALRRLESALQVRLFDRTSRGVTLTDYGRALYERAEALQNITRDIELEITDMRHGRAGTLRLGAVPALVEKIVAPVLTHFLEQRDDVHFKMCVQLSNELLRHLNDGELDLVIAAMPDTGPGDLSYLPLGNQEACVVACQHHPLTRTAFTLHELAAQKWLLLPTDITLRQWIDAVFVAADAAPPSVFVQTDATPAVFAALMRNTRLLTILTRDMLESHMGAGLVALSPPAPIMSIPLALFWRRQAYFSTLMAQCRERILAAFGRGAADRFYDMPDSHRAAWRRDICYKSL